MGTMGDRIKIKRNECHMTQTELGKILGVGKSAVLKYENGEVENIPILSIVKMANVFGVTPTWLMGFDDFYEQRLSDESILIDRIQTKFGKDAVKLLDMYEILNDEGKKKVLEYVEDLTNMDKYIPQVQGGSR